MQGLHLPSERIPAFPSPSSNAVLPAPFHVSLSNLDSHKKLIPVVLVSSLPWTLKFNFVPQNGVTCGRREKEELEFGRD